MIDTKKPNFLPSTDPALCNRCVGLGQFGYLIKNTVVKGVKVVDLNSRTKKNYLNLKVGKLPTFNHQRKLLNKLISSIICVFA